MTKLPTLFTRAVLLALTALTLFSCADDEAVPSAPPAHSLTDFCIINQGNYYDNIAGTLQLADGHTLTLGDAPQNGVILDTCLYVPCYASSDLAVISLRTAAIVRRVRLTAPQCICTDGRKLYVTQGDGTLAAIDPATSAIDTLPLAGATPYALVASRGKLYINCGNPADGLRTDNRVMVIDTRTLSLEKTVEVGINPYDQMAVDADGNIYTVCLGNYPATPEIWQITPDGSTSHYATGNLIAADGHTLYAICEEADFSTWPDVHATVTYTSIDTRTGQSRPLVLSGRQLPPYPSCLAVSPAGHLYIGSDAAAGNYNTPGTLHVFTPDGTQLSTRATGSHPYAIVFPQ